MLRQGVSTPTRIGADLTLSSSESVHYVRQKNKAEIRPETRRAPVGDATRARAAFERAMDLGFLDTDAPRAPEFATMRADPAWRRLEARLAERLSARAPRPAANAIDPTGG